MGTVIAFPRLPGTPEQRHGPDRRTTRRGGRRATDKPGFAPLVLLIDDDENSNARCEAILAKLHFAVAPTRTVEEAIRVMETLRPNLVIARLADAAAVRTATAAEVAVVLLRDDLLDPEALVEAIRRELRATKR